MGWRLSQHRVGTVTSRQSKVLWLDLLEFLTVIKVPVLAAWALEVTTWRRPALRDPHKRGPKQVYTVRARPRLALLIGCPLATDGHVRVISVGQYWTRRRRLGIWPFLFLFIGVAGGRKPNALTKGNGSLSHNSVAEACIRRGELQALVMQFSPEVYSLSRPFSANGWSDCHRMVPYSLLHANMLLYTGVTTLTALLGQPP